MKTIKLKIKCKVCGRMDLPNSSNKCRICDPNSFYKQYPSGKVNK